MTAGDQAYYKRRLAQESAAAGAAQCPHARQVHLDLAELYSARLRLIEALTSEASFDEPRQTVVPISRGGRR